VSVSRLHHPAIKVWIAEGLEEAALVLSREQETPRQAT
jgi:hypothetical protein